MSRYKRLCWFNLFNFEIWEASERECHSSEFGIFYLPHIVAVELLIHYTHISVYSVCVCWVRSRWHRLIKYKNRFNYYRHFRAWCLITLPRCLKFHCMRLLYGVAAFVDAVCAMCTMRNAHNYGRTKERLFHQRNSTISRFVRLGTYAVNSLLLYELVRVYCTFCMNVNNVRSTLARFIRLRTVLPWSASADGAARECKWFNEKFTSN